MQLLLCVPQTGGQHMMDGWTDEMAHMLAAAVVTLLHWVNRKARQTVKFAHGP